MKDLRKQRVQGPSYHFLFAVYLEIRVKDLHASRRFPARRIRLPDPFDLEMEATVLGLPPQLGVDLVDRGVRFLGRAPLEKSEQLRIFREAASVY